jgi:hypothetical protein
MTSPLIENHAYPKIRVAAFGIFLFLLGQILMIWSFVDGYFTAWTLGNLMIVTGLLLTLWTNTIQLGLTQSECRRLRDEVFRLRNLKFAWPNERNHSRPPKPKTSPRPISSKQARNKLDPTQ